MLLKKTKKILSKKAIARLRNRRIQRILFAIAIHRENTKRTQKQQKNLKTSYGKKDLQLRIKKIKGKISAGRKRARDRWTKRV